MTQSSLFAEPARTSIHCFEAAGLGKAPFRYLGMEHQEISYGNRIIGHIGGCAVETKPGGTCDYCGTAIINMFGVESADGRRFKVGCECIRKTGDSGLIVQVDRAVREATRQRNAAKKLAALEVDRLFCESAQIGLLADKPHPSSYFAGEGKTLADWARWMLAAKNYKALAVVLRRELGK